MVARSQPKSTLHGAHTEAEPAAAFTPGPWSAQPSEFDADGKPICWYVVRGEGRYDPAIFSTWPSSSNPEADARIGAAAPDLLEACQCALGHMTGNMDGDWGLGEDPAVLLRAAVARATGQ